MKRNKHHKKTREGSEWMTKITELGCVVCLREYQTFTPGVPHHPKDPETGRPVQDTHTICLCPAHHQTGGNGVAFHATGRKTWEKRYGTESELYEYTRNALKAHEEVM